MARRNDPLEDATPTEGADIVPSTMAFINKEAVGMDYVPDSFEDALRMAEAMGDGTVVEFQGSPYTLVDKSELIGIPFIITDIRMYEGTYGDTVAVMIVTKEPVKGKDKLVFNDGSTGVFEQVKGMVQATGRKGGIYCPNGLRKSDYKTTVEDPFDGPKEIEGTTYYVA